MEKVILRKMNKKEQKEYAKFSHELFLAEIAKTSREPAESVTSKIPNPTTELKENDLWYLIEQEQTHIGYFWIRLFPEKNSAFGYDIYLDKAHRGQGIGRQVMKEGRELLLQHGIKKLEICVFDENTTARKLYESMGFKEIDFDLKKRQHRMEIQLE
jgi:ribosomal protein S18 acetylase RimI-like enzyme